MMCPSSSEARVNEAQGPCASSKECFRSWEDSAVAVAVHMSTGLPLEVVEDDVPELE